MATQMLDPVDSWAEVDENYEEFPELDDELDLPDEDDELTEAEQEPPEHPGDIEPYWQQYELHGRNLDQGTAWERLAVEDYTGELEVAVEGLVAGARWEFRIRLVDRNGRYSRWSTPLQLTLPTDFTPPPTPTAPVVDENQGYVTFGWNGSLTGPIPEDLSHVFAWVRQMHPVDDPEGEPGDPRRLARFMEEGSQTTGALAFDVPHEFWLTSVDTTGNESPWSETVTVTPTLPVDAESIREELKELDGRMERLDQDLSGAVSDVQSDLNDFRQQWNDEWDPEAIDGLRDRQDSLEQDISDGLARADETIHRLAITDPHNLVRDLTFETFYEPGDPAQDLPGWYSNAANTWELVSADWGDPHTQFVRFNPDNLSEGSQLWYGGHLFANRWIKVTPGEQLRIRWQVLRYAGWSASDDFRFRVRFQDGDQNGVLWTDYYRWESVGNQQWAETIVTVPEGAAIGSFQWIKGSGATGASRGIGNVHVTRMNNGELTVDGSIKARHIDTIDLSAETGFIDRLETNLLRARLLDADEAMIDGILLKNNTISASKLRITNIDNMIGDPEFRDTEWWTTSGAAEPEFGTASRGRAVYLHSNLSSGDIYVSNQERPWVLQPGTQYYYSFDVYRNSAAASGADDARIWFIRTDETGAYQSGTMGPHGTSYNIMTDQGGGWSRVEGSIWGDDYGEAYFYLQMRLQGYTGGQFIIANPTVRPMTGSVLIEDGAVKAPHVDTQDLAADSAKMQDLAVGTGRFIEIDADQIRANSYEGHVMTSPLVQSHSANNQGWKLNPGGDFTIYDGSGDVSIRLDGQNNVLTGRIEAGFDSGSGSEGVNIDYGTVTLTTGWEDADSPGEVTSQFETAYLEFQPNNSNQVITPKIWVDDNGQMRISPGRTSDVPQLRSMLRVHGDIRTGRFHATHGEFSRNISAWGSQINTLAGGVRVLTSSSTQHAGIIPDGPRTRYQGRMPDEPAGIDTFTVGTTSSSTLSPGAATRSTVTFGTPAISGVRRMILSSHVANTGLGYDNWRTSIVSSAGVSASSFRYIVRAPDENGGDVQTWVYYLGIWQ
ncbi:hypothetical protein Q7C18_02730 [Nesterenkonia sp. CL21]|uniref:hypothetical protein n=1 Tax=Nesterenkonia sp. CL21 TaxID=3064894 RepID=UPI00287A27D5|nr:hypothetical protein [Nesterenkonia sp. CL21]MDS2171604.1 hypothetical protein [Nesterenkonia sp. CL21]